MVQVFLARSGMAGIIHTNIPWRFATRTTFLEVLTVATLKDVHLREVYTGIVVTIDRAVLGTQMLCKGRRAFGTEFTMEYEDTLWLTVPANAGNRLVRSCAEKVLLQLHRCIYVDCSWNVATVVFIIKSAVNNLV